jgi:hypothetical protein
MCALEIFDTLQWHHIPEELTAAVGQLKSLQRYRIKKIIKKNPPHWWVTESQGVGNGGG